MSAAPCLIYDDPRPIKAIWFEGEGGFEVRDADHPFAPGDPVTRIVAYKEHGEGDFVPWLAIYRGDHLRTRVPARMVQIVYAPEASGG